MKSWRSVLCSAPSNKHLGGKNKNNNTTCHTVQNQTIELFLKHEDGSRGGVMILQHKLSTFLDATPPSSSLIQRPRVVEGVWMHAAQHAPWAKRLCSTSWLTWRLGQRSSRSKWQPAFPTAVSNSISSRLGSQTPSFVSFWTLAHLDRTSEMNVRSSRGHKVKREQHEEQPRSQGTTHVRRRTGRAPEVSRNDACAYAQQRHQMTRVK